MWKQNKQTLCFTFFMMLSAGIFGQTAQESFPEIEVPTFVQSMDTFSGDDENYSNVTENYQAEYDGSTITGGLQIDSANLKNAADKLDYSETEKIEKKAKDRDISFEKIKESPVWGGDGFKTLVYFIVFIILGVGVYYLLTKTLGKREIELSEIQVGNSEITNAENLSKLPLDELLISALEKGDYRLAIRILYLKILKELFVKGLIVPSAEKTNYDYLNELKGTEFRQLFAETTGYFEQVYYGDFSLGTRSYGVLSGKFNHFFHIIRLR